MQATKLILASKIDPSPQALALVLDDGRRVKIPWARCSQKLAAANREQRLCAELSPGGYGIHWPLIDEDLSIAGLVRRSESGL